MAGTQERHRIRLPCEAASVRKARQFVGEHLRAWVVGDAADDAIDDAQLVASELVGNAVRYGGEDCGDIEVCLERLTAEVEIRVVDASTAVPVPAEASPTAESGRGLAIVGALCADWGVQPVAGHGKAVWGRLAVTGLRTSH